MKKMKLRSNAAMQLATELKIDMNKVTVIEAKGSHPDDPGCCFSVPGAKSVFISRQDMSFIEALRELPAVTRIKIMNLTDAEMQKVMQDSREKIIHHLVMNLSLTWYWRETGYPTGELAGIIPHTTLGQKKLLRQLINGKCTLTNNQLKEINDWFMGDRAQVYTKN